VYINIGLFEPRLQTQRLCFKLKLALVANERQWGK
jgi:hypothetical protein